MPKRLIVCSDGTWNTPEQSSPTNVVKMARAIAPQAPGGKPQIVFYDPGVGTDNLLDKISGGLSGAGLSKNVQDAYRFLVHNYTPGDDTLVLSLVSYASLVQRPSSAAASDVWITALNCDSSPEYVRIKNFGGSSQSLPGFCIQSGPSQEYEPGPRALHLRRPIRRPSSLEEQPAMVNSLTISTWRHDNSCLPSYPFFPTNAARQMGAD